MASVNHIETKVSKVTEVVYVIGPTDGYGGYGYQIIERIDGKTNVLASAIGKQEVAIERASEYVDAMFALSLERAELQKKVNDLRRKLTEVR